MIGGASFSIQADPEDKRELLKRLSEKGVKVRHFGTDTTGTLQQIYFTVRTLVGLIIIYEFLKEKKEKDIEVIINKSNGESITVSTKNADKLKIKIDEYKETKS